LGTSHSQPASELTDQRQFAPVLMVILPDPPEAGTVAELGLSEYQQPGSDADTEYNP
jgi:hypothetical protein